jgi:hypothetical protein
MKKKRKKKHEKKGKYAVKMNYALASFVLGIFIILILLTLLGITLTQITSPELFPCNPNCSSNDHQTGFTGGTGGTGGSQFIPGVCYCDCKMNIESGMEQNLKPLIIEGKFEWSIDTPVVETLILRNSVIETNGIPIRCKNLHIDGSVTLTNRFGIDDGRRGGYSRGGDPTGSHGADSVLLPDLPRLLYFKGGRAGGTLDVQCDEIHIDTGSRLILDASGENGFPNDAKEVRQEQKGGGGAGGNVFVQVWSAPLASLLTLVHSGQISANVQGGQGPDSCQAPNGAFWLNGSSIPVPLQNESKSVRLETSSSMRIVSWKPHVWSAFRFQRSSLYRNHLYIVSNDHSSVVVRKPGRYRIRLSVPLKPSDHISKQVKAFLCVDEKVHTSEPNGLSYASQSFELRMDTEIVLAAVCSLSVRMNANYDHLEINPFQDRSSFWSVECVD